MHFMLENGYSLLKMKLRELWDVAFKSQVFIFMKQNPMFPPLMDTIYLMFTLGAAEI